MIKHVIVAAVAIAALGSQAANAGTATFVAPNSGSLSVLANVAASCTYNVASAMDFKTIQTMTSAITPVGNGGTNGAIQVACDAGQEFALGLGQGNNYASTRQMANGSARLGYELYVDSALTQVFGDAAVGSGTGAAHSAANVGGVGNGITNFTTYTIYGKIPAGTKPAPGSYFDNVTVSVVY